MNTTKMDKFKFLCQWEEERGYTKEDLSSLILMAKLWLQLEIFFLIILTYTLKKKKTMQVVFFKQTFCWKQVI